MQQLKGESNYEFQQRELFYNFLKNNNTIDIKDYEKITKIWANIKFRNCKYSSNLYHFISTLDKQFKKI